MKLKVIINNIYKKQKRETKALQKQNQRTYRDLHKVNKALLKKQLEEIEKL